MDTYHNFVAYCFVVVWPNLHEKFVQPFHFLIVGHLNPSWYVLEIFKKHGSARFYIHLKKHNDNSTIN